jgi:protein TonB
MPAVIHKIDFSAPADRPEDSSQSSFIGRKVIPFALESEHLAMHRPLDALPCCRRHEGAAALLLALGLHFAGLAWMPEAEREEPLTAPAPIQVAWIAAPQSKPENPPAPPPTPKRQPVNKPKPKPKAAKPIKTRPKAVLSTHAPAPVTAPAPAENAEKTPPSITKPLEAPPSRPAASAVPTPSAPSEQASDSRQPLVLPNLNADYLNNPAPPYPEEARERGEQGKVLVRALINADGTVAELAMKRSSGFPGLDRSALETVKKWRFVPARRGAAAVSAWVVVPISFSLEG